MDLPSTVGRYEVVRLLGEGGFGRVLLARDPTLGRVVAVKVLRSDLPLDEDARRALVVRLRDEARATAGLSHPNLVALHDMGEDPALGPYLVFEHVDGQSLRERLRSEPLAPLEVAKLARELGSALTYAHDAGLVHRDVKPENVLLSPTGAKLSDFGIGRLADEKGAPAELDLGTPAYCAPEVLGGGQHGPASDQFSLAATLFEAMSGRRPFPGADPESIALRIAEEDPPLVAHEAKLEPRVDGVLLRGMAKDLERRFTSCRAFGDALATAIEQSATVAPPPSIDTPPPSKSVVPRATRRKQNIAAGAAVLLIAGLIVFGRQREDAGVSMRSVAAEFLAVLHAAGSTAPRAPRTVPVHLRATAEASTDAADEAGVRDPEPMPGSTP
jgi:serine/threonine protein kinase